MKILFLTLVMAAPLSAADYYVAPNGSDRSRGSREQPFGTIARGLAAARSPGDNVTVRKGVYRPAAGLRLVNPGADGRPITLRAAPDEEVVIDGLDTPKDSNLINIATHHIRVQGLTVRNSTGIGIAAWGPGSRVNHVEIIGNTILHCHRSGIYAGFNQLSDPVRDLVFEGNVIHDNVQRNKASPRPAWDFGMGAGHSKNVTMRNNVVYQNYGEGIGLYLSDRGVIEGNVSHDNFSINVYLDNATRCRVDRNFIYCTGDRDFFRFDQPAAGVQIANERYGPSANPSSDNVIINNVLVGNLCAFRYGSYQGGGGLKNTVFAHNTAYGSTGALLSIDADAGHANTRIINNIFQQIGRVPMTNFRAQPGQIEMRNNLWAGVQPQPSARGEGDVMGDPLFVRPGGKSAGDYRPMKESRALNAGLTIEDVTVDFGGRRRVGPMDLGAWESP